MLSQTPGAVAIRTRRAAMTPEQREAYLAEKRARAARDRADPAKQPKLRAQANASYQRRKADPARNAASNAWARKYYKANREWRLVQEAGLRAKARALGFDLTREWLESTWTGKCALTGLPFVTDGKRGLYSASLDRVDNKRGYTQDNCRWVLWAVNLLKHTGTDAELFEIAQAIVRGMRGN